MQDISHPFKGGVKGPWDSNVWNKHTLQLRIVGLDQRVGFELL